MTKRAGFLLLLAVVSPCLCSSAGQDSVVYVSVILGGDKELDCGQEVDKWTFSGNTNNNNSEPEVIGDTDHFSINAEDNKLKIQDIQESQLGLYQCMDENGDMIKEFDVDGNFRIKKMPKSVPIDDGSKAELTCSLKVKPQFEEEVLFRWYTAVEGLENDLRVDLCPEGSKHNCPENNVVADALFDTRDKSVPVSPLEERAKIETLEDEKGVPFSRLTISPAYTDDRQYYICQATLKGSQEEDTEECSGHSNKECDETITLLRVKDPLAALYPFIGIVAEVIVLCIVIFFCERSKSDDKEEYDEVAGNGSAVTSSNMNLRQRKQ